MQMAEDVDHEMSDLERGAVGILDYSPSYMPGELKAHGLPDGYLRGIDL